MPGLVLHFGRERQLAPKRRRVGDPAAFRQRADDLAVRVLRDHADQLAAIFVGHPVGRLDLLAARDACFEGGQLRFEFRPFLWF